MKKKHLVVGCLSLVCLGVMGQEAIQNNGNFRMHTGAQIGLFGNFTNNSASTNNLGEVQFVGSTQQTFAGSSAFNGHSVTVNNAGNLKVDNELQISNIFTFVNGLILSDRVDEATEFVHFLDGSSYSGQSDARYIDGVVRKTGNDAFSFPVGDDNQIQLISISAPGNATDHFTAYYTEASANASGYSSSSKASSIDHISDCEFWILNRTGGSSNVNVTLSFDANSCGVTDLSDLRVARWDGSEWQDHGNGGTTGTLTTGTVVSSAAITAFSPFTLASNSAQNPLPIELLEFSALPLEDEVLVNWETASERNNDYFEVQRSATGTDWNTIGTVKGKGNSTDLTEYEFYDKNPLIGTSYYRLKQVDFNGESTTSHVETVHFIDAISDIRVYPNPGSDPFHLAFPRNLIANDLVIDIYDVLGQKVYTMVKPKNAGEIQFSPNLPKGVYYIRIEYSDVKSHLEFIVQ